MAPQQGSSQGGSSLRLSVEIDLFGHGLAGMAYGRRTRVIQVTMAHVKGGDRKFLPRSFAGMAKNELCSFKGRKVPFCKFAPEICTPRFWQRLTLTLP